MLKVDMRNTIIYCACDTEAIHIQPDTYEGKANYTDISIWEYGCGDSKTSWKQKLRYIWRIIKHGTPYGDQVILDKAGRGLLIEALQAYDVDEYRVWITNTDTSVSSGIEHTD